MICHKGVEMIIAKIYKDGDIEITSEDTSPASTEAGSVSNETTTEATTLDEDSIIETGYDYQYSNIEFLAPFNEETSEYEPLIFDNTPYMSSEVANADINDVYTMVLSIRNVVLLWFLLWVVFKARTMIHSVLERVYERRSKK